MAMTMSVRNAFTLTSIIALSKYLKGFTPKFVILDISGNNRKPVENFEQIIGK